jgi:predicted HTH transcriptional regulator
MGESPTLEFKSSLRWDFRQKEVNKALQKAIAKTVAGLMNSEGGTLLIGVADDGAILGIENDLKSLSRQDLDGFEQTFRQVLAENCGAEFSHLVSSVYESVDGATVAVIGVDPSPRPVYVDGSGGTEFFVRVGNTTRPLDLQASHDYIRMHWEN